MTGTCDPSGRGTKNSRSRSSGGALQELGDDGSLVVRVVELGQPSAEQFAARAPGIIAHALIGMYDLAGAA